MNQTSGLRWLRRANSDPSFPSFRSLLSDDDPGVFFGAGVTVPDGVLAAVGDVAGVEVDAGGVGVV